MPFQAALSSAPGIRGMPIPSYLSIYESFCRKPEHIRSLSDAYAHCWTDILFRYMDSHLQAHGLPLHQHAGSPAGIQPLPADIRHRPVHIPAHIRHHSAHIRYFHMLPPDILQMHIPAVRILPALHRNCILHLQHYFPLHDTVLFPLLHKSELLLPVQALLPLPFSFLKRNSIL